jgi:hypothetical protein
MEGINPLTGQPFQTFDAGVTTDAITQGRQAEEQRQRDMLIAAQERAAAEQTATETAAQVERDRVAAEQAAIAQAEQDRIATERAENEALAIAERELIAENARKEAESDAKETARQKAEEVARQRRDDIVAGRFDPTDMDQFGGEGQMYGGPAFRPSTSMGGEKGGGIGQIMTGLPNQTVFREQQTEPYIGLMGNVIDPVAKRQEREAEEAARQARADAAGPRLDVGMGEALGGMGGMFSGAIPGLTPEQIENIKQAQEQRRASGQSGFLGKLGVTKTDPIADIGSMGGVGGMMGGIGGMADPEAMELVRRQVAAVQPPPQASTPKPAKSVGRSKGRRKPVPPKPNTETVKKKRKAPTTRSRRRRR